MTTKLLHIGWVSLLCCGIGCSKGAPDSAAPAPVEAKPAAELTAVAKLDDQPLTVGLGEAQREGDLLRVTVDYARGAAPEGPRVMELRVKLSAGLEFVSAEAGLAVTRAGKRLVAQSQGEVVRLIALSSQSLDRIADGPLAELTLRDTTGRGGQLELLYDQPLFAPSPANQGLVKAPPLVIAAAGGAR